MGEGRSAGEGALCDPCQLHRPGSGSSGRPEWLPMFSRLGQRPAGQLRTRCPLCGSSRRLRLARQLRPAVRSSQRKGQAPSNSRRPPAERLLARAGGPRPFVCIPPAHHDPHRSSCAAHPFHLHSACSQVARPPQLPNASLVRPAHLICISLLSVQRLPPGRGRDAQLTDFRPLGADAQNCSRTR